MMFNANTIRLFASSSPSSVSWNDVELKMKQLIDSKQYVEVLNLYHEQCQSSSKIILNLALKACTKLGDYERGTRIHQQISAQLIQDSFIQTSLIHFYSKIKRNKCRQLSFPFRFAIAIF